MEIILDNTRHLVRLLNDLLDLARSDAGRLTINPVPTEVGPIVAERGALDAGPRPRLAPAAARGRDRGRPSAGQRRAGPDPPGPGQPAHQRHTSTARRARRSRSPRSAVGTEVEVAVSDDGPGIPEEQLEHIFERFTRGEAGLTQRVGGTGLGLAISKSLVELHGGAIGVTSDGGRGRHIPHRPARPPEGEAAEEPAAASGAELMTRSPGRRRLGDDPAADADAAGDGGLRGHHRRRRRRRRSRRSPQPARTSSRT